MRLIRKHAPAALAYVLLLALAVALQWRGGAYQAEFGGEPDEASHYITALMIRDYAAAGAPGAPMAYAENYYLHYPKVAFGIWPPVYHILTAGWMLLFSPGRVSVIFFMALWTALLALFAFNLVREEFGWWAGLATGALVVSFPIVQRGSSSVMLDVPMAVFISYATFAFGRFVDTDRTADAARFGLWASLGIMTKYNALALALVPPVILVLTGRYRLVKRAAFWLPLGIVILLCGPWYWAMRKWVAYASEPVPGIADILPSTVANTHILIELAGGFLLVLALAGWWTQGGHRESPHAGKWAAAPALIFALWFFHSVPYPIIDPRYFVPAAPAMALLIAAGAAALIGYAKRKTPHAAWSVPPALVVLIAAVYLGTHFRIPKKVYRGYTELVRNILAQPGLREATVLVSAEGTGEGMLIAELAMHEQRPGHFVLRASKVLAQSTWMLERYRLRYATSEKIADYLRQTDVALVVIDHEPGPIGLPHHQLLIDAVRRLPNARRQGSYQGAPGLNPIDLYQLPYHPTKSIQRLTVDMTPTLGRSLQR